jgi:crossover junction endodeoxyribonuclease RuvC
MAALAMAGVPVSEFAPRQIKLSVVGTGTADKDQVKFMVQRLLPRAGDMKLDAADALACAICTAHHLPDLLRKKGAA